MDINTIMDINNDDRKDVQPYPVEVWPETRPVLGHSSSGEQLYPYQVAVVLGRGKLHEDRGGPNEVGGIHR